MIWFTNITRSPTQTLNAGQRGALSDLIAIVVFFCVAPVSILSTTACAQESELRSSNNRSSTQAILDPIQENFGARPSPYPGFLVLPPEAVLSGFGEIRHHYTKREYTVDFTRMVGGKTIELNIVESDYAVFFHDHSELIQEFEYQGIRGQVYAYYNQKTQETTFNLIWLNPPKQRIAIYLTQTPSKEYFPEDLIRILKRMESVR